MTASPLPHHLRSLAPQDAAGLAALERAGSATPWSEKQIAVELEKPGSQVWVAEVAGRPAGYVVLWLAGEEGQVANIAVDRALRRRGLGRALLAQAEAGARQAGARCLTLEVRAGNHEARALYENRGFRTTGRRNRYYDNSEDALLMEKSL